MYRDLGIREFWQIDPAGWIRDPIIGYALRGRVYRRIPPSRPGVYRSDVLNAEISYDRTEVAVHDMRTGERIPLIHDSLRQRNEALRERDDALRQRDDAMRQRTEERKAHEAALARVAELEARLKD